MSESDQTWNAESGEPTEANEITDANETPEANETTEANDSASWPHYSWPPAADVPSPTAASPQPDPTQLDATQPNATQANPPTEPIPSAAGPYASGPYSAAPGAWSSPPLGWTAPAPGAWPPAQAAPPAPPAQSKTRRGLAAIAALALVLASAGVGAGVAIAVHNNSDTRSFSTGNPPSGNGTFNPGNNFGGNGTGTIPSGTGSLDRNAIANKVDPALVNINTTLSQGRAAGTGMLISSTGEILTNNHVIADATSIKVTVGGTGPTYSAKVVGYDVTEDVAMLQITDKVSGLPTITFGDPAKVQIGDPVVAIGNALGKGGKPSASQGQVTALNQQVTAGDTQGSQETLQNMIQINAPIQPGDSGGALVDGNAQVIGMNTAAAGAGRFNGSGSNVGFAIPIDNAVQIVSQIRTGVETDKVYIGDRGLLGVQVLNVTGQNTTQTSGAYVDGVADNTGAIDAGIKQGDVLTTLDGKPIADPDGLRTLLSKFHAGDSVKVGWVDANGAHHEAAVKLIVGPPL
jgi:S1-C subfamily serine protease